jgi:pilus assembly protein Flp/PilA
MSQVVLRAAPSSTTRRVGENQPFSGFKKGFGFPDSLLASFGEEVTLFMLIQMFHRLRQRDEDGQALVEYALILGLIAVFSITALTTLGGNVSAVLNSIASAIGNVL